MDQISRLGLDIETSGLVRGTSAVDRFATTADRAEREATQLERRTRSLGTQMSVLGGMAQNLALQLGAAFSVYSVIRANDAWVSATNQIRLVTDGARELRDMTQQVYDLSQRTASRFEAMTGLYASIQRAAGAAIGSQREVLRITETIAKLAAASGGPEGSRSAALFQLRQMLQGAVVQAQEFNSLVDGTPLLVQAIADSIGVTRGELRRMVLDGNLATSTVIAALQEQADEADALFSQVQFTVGDAMIRLQNAFQKLVGTNLGPLFSGVVKAIGALAEHLDALVPILSGVAAAFAVAFAPSIVLAMGAAIKGLFLLIAAHPLAALVGAIVAAGVAIDRFGDSITITSLKFKDLGEAAAAGASDVDAAFETLDISLRDMLAGLVTVIADEAGNALQQLSRVAKTAGEETQTALDENEAAWYEYGGAVDQFVEKWGNRLIGAVRETFFVLAHQWDAAALTADLAWKKIQNSALGALEAIANAAQDHLTFGGDQLPDIRLGRIDTSEAEESLRDFQTRNQAVIDSFYSEDYLGNFRRRVMGEAEIIAQARQAAGEGDAPEADPAAAAAAAATNEALQKQIRSRQQLFDVLQAQLELNEHEFQIYQETEELLRQFPGYYARAAAGAEDIAQAAHDAAEEDARRLDSLRRQIAAQASLKQMAVDALRQQRLIAAAGAGPDAFDVEERTLELLEQHAELYEQAGKGAEAAARADAERQLANERILDTLTAQVERARELADAPIDNLRRNFDQATDDFWTDFVNDAGSAFENIGDAFSNMWKQLQADILRDMFNPFLTAIREGLVNAISGATSGKGGGGFGSIFDTIAGLFGGGKTVGAPSMGSIGMGVPGTPQSGGGFGSILSSIGQIFGIGGGGAGAGGLSQIGGVLGQIGQVFAVSQIGSGIANALGLVKKQAGGQIGGTIGAALGMFVGGPIGGMIGSFLGSTIGGLFGPGVTSAQTAIQLNASGGVARGPWGVGGDDEMTSETIAAANAVAQRIAEGQELMRQLGGTLTSYVSEFNISAEREASNFQTTNSATGQSQWFVHASPVADPDALVNAALGEVLSGVNFADPVLEAVRAAMSDAGKGFEETLKVLGKLKDVLPDTEEQTSQWKQALDALNETFADLRASTAGVAGVAEQLDAAFASAKDALKVKFAESIEDAITGIENPVELQFEELMKVQAQRLADATALGADVARVMHLNELELTSFIEQAAGSAAAFENLNAIFEELIANAAAAGNATQPLVDAYNQARAGVVTAFDDSVAQQLANITNPTLGALKALLDAQKSRLDQARTLGANILAVERLNAAEQRAFFDGLSEEQKQALASHLGLIEDFTGRIAVVLSQLGDELNTRIDDVDRMRSDLLNQSEAMRTLSENLAQTRQGIVDRYGALTPMAGVEALRERLTELAADARGGNDSALQALGQVGQQLIDASRALYGSTSTFRGDYDLVTQILEEAELLANGRADTLESQAQTLIEQRDLLIEIRNVLSQPDPSLEALQLYLGQLDANQDVVANLLGQYLQLAAQQAGQSIDLGQLYQQATNAAQTPTLSATQSSGMTPTPSASNSTGVQAPATTGATSTTTADSATAQMVAVLIDVVQQGNATQEDDQRNIRRELRNLNERLGVGGSGSTP